MTRAAWWITVAVTVASCQKRDPLYCGLHLGDPLCALDDGGLGGADSPPGYVTIGGTVTGVTGAGLVLQNNADDDKSITSDGQFRFATALPIDTAYAVTVSTQPTNPSQMCTVTMGAGTTGTTDVTDVQVNCTTAAYTIGGTVIGCTGGCPAHLVLTDNNGDDLLIPGNGPFTFITPVPSQMTYAVAVKTNPGGCSVSGGNGTVGNSDISSIVVNCTPNSFTLGGSSPMGGVTGLNGKMMLHAVYTNPTAPADTITVSTNSFAFPTALVSNQTWAINISAQPMFPPAAQTCAISLSATGTIANANVTSVTIGCMTKQFTVGGAVAGLMGTVVLQINGGDDLTLTSNSNFTFVNPLYSGTAYAVTVRTQPPGQYCSLTKGSGTVGNGNVTNVAVTCGDAGVKCGASYCNFGEKCCDPEGNKQCIGAMSSCSQLSLPCDDAADCVGNKKCCAMTHNGNGNIESVSCSSSCGGDNPVQLCDPAVAGECSSGTCQPWSSLPGYYACL